jgi:hypothetical protein
MFFLARTARSTRRLYRLDGGLAVLTVEVA